MPPGDAANRDLGPSFALLGVLDGTDYGELLEARILERELRARLPHARVDRYSALAVDSPFAVDGGRPILELGPAEASRVAALTARHDLLALTAALARSPALSAPWDELRVAPACAVLAARLFPADVLRKRLDYLRVMGWYPEGAAPAVVHGDLGDAAAVQAPVVLLGPAGGEARTPLFGLPPQVTLEDVTAAIAHARAVVSTSEALRAAATSFGVPAAAPGEALDSGSAIELKAGVDAELDELAAAGERAWAARATSDGRADELLRALAYAEERYEALLRAYDRRGERIVQERLRYAEIVDGLEAAAAGLSAEAVLRAAELETQLEIASAAEAEARFELERLRAEQERAADA